MDIKNVKNYFVLSCSEMDKSYYIDNRLCKQPTSLSPVFNNMNKYLTPFTSIVNPLTVGIEIFDAIIYLNEKIKKICEEHFILQKITPIIKNIYQLNVEKEELIHSIKRIIDDLIVVLAFYYDQNNIKMTNTVRYLSLGQLLEENNNNELINSIKEEFNYNKYYAFLKIINDLHNAIKHSCLLNSSHQLFSRNDIMYFVYYSRRGKLTNVDFLCCSLKDIMTAFSDFLLEFFNIEISDKTYSIQYY